MVKKASKELNVKITTTGSKRATKEVKSVTKAIDENTTAQNKMKRAQEGVAKSSLSTAKSFSKQQQGLGGLVRSYATIAANVFALTQVFQILRNAADFYSMQKAAEDMARVSGVNMMRLAKEVQRATGHNLALRDALESVNKTLAAGATPTQAAELANLAAKISQTFGGSVEANINKINSAVLRGRTELLATLGVVIDTQQVYRDYAAQLGKTLNELTIFEKKQATINAIQEEGNKILGDVNLDRNPYLALLTTLTDVTDQLLQMVNTFGTFFVEIINESEKFSAALVATLGAVFARKLTPDAETYARTAREALKSVQVAVVRQSRTEIGLAIKAADLRRARTARAIADSRKELTERLRLLKSTESAERKFANTTQSLFKKIEAQGIMTFKNIGKATRKELAVLQAQITKTLSYREKIAGGETVKPLRGVSSGIAKADTRILRQTRDLIDEQLDSNRKLGREVKKLEVSQNSLGLTLRNLNAQRKLATANIQRMAASQKILTLRLVEQRGVFASILPAYEAVNRRVRRLSTEAGVAGLAVRTLTRATGYLATTTTLLGTAINRVFPILTALWLAWEIGTAIYNKFFKASEEQNKALEEAAERYESYTESVKDAEKALADLADLRSRAIAGDKTQLALSKFVVNFSNTLTSALANLINPLVFSPTIKPKLDPTEALRDINKLKDELRGLYAQREILEARAGQVGPTSALQVSAGAEGISGLIISLLGLSQQANETSEDLGELNLKIKELEETANNIQLELDIQVKYDELLQAQPTLAAFSATLETITRLQTGATLSGFTFDTTGIEAGLKGTNAEIQKLIRGVLAGEVNTLEFKQAILDLAETSEQAISPDLLKNLLDGVRLGEIRIQSLAGSMATISEQFIRAAGAAAKTREQLTNLTVNPELTRATSVILKDFENLARNIEGNEDGIARFINIDILERADAELKAIFNLSKNELKALVAESGNAETALARLLSILRDRQEGLFSTARAKLLEQESKLSKEIADNYQKQAKIAPTITSALELLDKTETNLVESAEKLVEARKEAVRAAEEELALVTQNQPNDRYSIAVAKQKVAIAKQQVDNAETDLKLAKEAQLVDKERLTYLERINTITQQTLQANATMYSLLAKNTTILSKQAEFSAKNYDTQLKLLDNELESLRISKEKFTTLKELSRYQREELERLEAQEELVKARMEDLYLQVALEQQILDIRSRGNRYNPLPGDIKQFGRDLNTILRIEAYNFSKGMKTAAEEWAKVILDTTDTLVNSLVDDIIEGGVDVVEAVKAAIRSGVGDIVKENIKGTVRNLLANIFPGSKAGKIQTQEEALKRLEESLRKEGQKRIAEARKTNEEARKANEISEEEAQKREEQLKIDEDQLILMESAEGRDVIKVDQLKNHSTTLLDIKNYLTTEQKARLQDLVRCCNCACSNKGTMDFGPSLFEFTPDITTTPDITVDAPEPTATGPTEADRMPAPSIVIPPTTEPVQDNTNTDAVRAGNDRRNELLQESNDLTRQTNERLANIGTENVKKHNETYTRNMDPNREADKSATFDFAFNSILKTFTSMIFGPFGSIFNMFSGGGGFDFGGLFGLADGGVIPKGINSMATGGIVDKAQIVQIGEGKTAEAVVPLPNNREIPVKLEGERNQLVFNQSFDFRNADPATETRLRQQMEEIKRATITTVQSELNRGGSLAKRTGRR